jgi:hypothetical protein
MTQEELNRLYKEWRWQDEVRAVILEETTASNRECAKKNISLVSPRSPRRNRNTGDVKGKDLTQSKQRNVKLVSTSASGMSALGVIVAT